MVTHYCIIIFAWRHKQHNIVAYPKNLQEGKMPHTVKRHSVIVKQIRAASRENRSSGFPTRFDTNRPMQLQKMIRCLKSRNKEEGSGHCYAHSENKGADQLCSHCTSDLCLYYVNVVQQRWCNGKLIRLAIKRLRDRYPAGTNARHVGDKCSP